VESKNLEAKWESMAQVFGASVFAQVLAQVFVGSVLAQVFGASEWRAQAPK